MLSLRIQLFFHFGLVWFGLEFYDTGLEGCLLLLGICFFSCVPVDVVVLKNTRSARVMRSSLRPMRGIRLKSPQTFDFSAAVLQSTLTKIRILSE